MHRSVVLGVCGGGQGRNSQDGRFTICGLLSYLAVVYEDFRSRTPTDVFMASRIRTQLYPLEDSLCDSEALSWPLCA